MPRPPRKFILVGGPLHGRIEECTAQYLDMWTPMPHCTRERYRYERARITTLGADIEFHAFVHDSVRDPQAIARAVVGTVLAQCLIADGKPAVPQSVVAKHTPASTPTP